MRIFVKHLKAMYDWSVYLVAGTRITEDKISKIKALAAKLPTGLDDPASLHKYLKESVEFFEAHQSRNRVEMALEAADRVYYLVKAEANRLILRPRRDRLIDNAAYDIDLGVDTVLDCVIAKYELRAQKGNPKNPEAERAAIREILLRHDNA